MASVFIDGEAGTTGLQIYQRLAGRKDIDIISIDLAKRKDAGERSRLLNEADVAILCLPDDAAREAASWVNNPNTKVLDASTAHRTAPDWVYGFPEMAAGHREKIAHSKRVSNPGCYPTGFLALVAPLVHSGQLPADFPITINAISGYSGGGKKLIAQYDELRAEAIEKESTVPYSPYGLQFGHKHVKEMQTYAGLAHAPLFVPSVGDFLQGMVVQVPLPLWSLSDAPSGEVLHGALKEHYAGEPFVRVMAYGDRTQLRG
ncbi:MAG: N-acetyl-gamma-glutamyl-phosphate reductase, partial [Cyanobacteria bacterium J06623_5]